MMDIPTAMKSLANCEVVLLKKASKASQVQNRLAEEFREMLIERECISSCVSYLEFMGQKDLVTAIRLCWRLGYDDEVSLYNLSDGLMSDFAFLQATPVALEAIVPDPDELKRLTNKRIGELQRISRNVDAFIRNMGWIEGPPPKKRKATVTKEQMIGTVDQILSKATSNNASTEVASVNSSVTSGTSSLGKAMGKACISEEAVEEDEEENLMNTDSEHEVDKNPKPMTSKLLKGKKPLLKGINEMDSEKNIMDSDSEKNMMDSDSEHEVDKNFKLMTLMKGVKDDCSVVVFRDTEGAIQTKKLTAKSTKIVKAAVTEEVTFWTYYWTDSELPMTEEEYQQHLDDGGDEAEVSYD